MPAKERSPEFYLLLLARPVALKAFRNRILFLTCWDNFTVQLNCSVKLATKLKANQNTFKVICKQLRKILFI